MESIRHREAFNDAESRVQNPDYLLENALKDSCLPSSSENHIWRQQENFSPFHSCYDQQLHQMLINQQSESVAIPAKRDFRFQWFIWPNSSRVRSKTQFEDPHVKDVYSKDSKQSIDDQVSQVSLPTFCSLIPPTQKHIFPLDDCVNVECVQMNNIEMPCSPQQPQTKINLEFTKHWSEVDDQQNSADPAKIRDFQMQHLIGSSSVSQPCQSISLLNVPCKKNGVIPPGVLISNPSCAIPTSLFGSSEKCTSNSSNSLTDNNSMTTTSFSSLSSSSTTSSSAFEILAVSKKSEDEIENEDDDFEDENMTEIFTIN
uniref:Uncharacterized protein n=1 Tax=Ditylenchus dipsaci TaxID=166011 RepID=A0A915EJY3_9BILA